MPCSGCCCSGLLQAAVLGIGEVAWRKHKNSQKPKVGTHLEEQIITIRLISLSVFAVWRVAAAKVMLFWGEHLGVRCF